MRSLLTSLAVAIFFAAVPARALANDASNAAAGGAVILFVMFLWALGLGLYFVPTIIAFVRNKSNKIAILALNFFLGWSLIGWVVSLVWALSNEQQPVIVQQSFAAHPTTGLEPPNG